MPPVTPLSAPDRTIHSQEVIWRRSVVVENGRKKIEETITETEKHIRETQGQVKTSSTQRTDHVHDKTPGYCADTFERVQSNSRADALVEKTKTLSLAALLSDGAMGGNLRLKLRKAQGALEVFAAAHMTSYQNEGVERKHITLDPGMFRELKGLWGREYIYRGKTRTTIKDEGEYTVYKIALPQGKYLNIMISPVYEKDFDELIAVSSAEVKRQEGVFLPCCHKMRTLLSTPAAQPKDIITGMITLVQRMKSSKECPSKDLLHYAFPNSPAYEVFQSLHTILSQGWQEYSMHPKKYRLLLQGKIQHVAHYEQSKGKGTLFSQVLAPKFDEFIGGVEELFSADAREARAWASKISNREPDKKTAETMQKSRVAKDTSEQKTQHAASSVLYTQKHVSSASSQFSPGAATEVKKPVAPKLYASTNTMVIKPGSFVTEETRKTSHVVSVSHKEITAQVQLKGDIGKIYKEMCTLAQGFSTWNSTKGDLMGNNTVSQKFSSTTGVVSGGRSPENTGFTYSTFQNTFTEGMKIIALKKKELGDIVGQSAQAKDSHVLQQLKQRALDIVLQMKQLAQSLQGKWDGAVMAAKEKAHKLRNAQKLEQLKTPEVPNRFVPSPLQEFVRSANTVVDTVRGKISSVLGGVGKWFGGKDKKDQKVFA